MKNLLTLILAIFLSTFAHGGDAPRGTFEFKDLELAKAKAIQTNKLISFLYTDKDTTCSLCQNATDVFMDAVKSKSVIVYLHSPQTSDIWPKLPALVQTSLLPGEFIPKVVVMDVTLSNVIGVISYDDYKLDANKAMRTFKKSLK